MMRAAVAVSKYVPFADPKVLEVLLANITTDDGIGLTTADVEKVTSIGTWFKGNTVIKEFNEFEKFTGLTPNTNTHGFFQSCTALTTIKLPPCDVFKASKSCFSGCVALESVVIPTEITQIGNYMFQNCASLADCVLPTSIRTIGEYAFMGCTSFTGDINLPNLEETGGNFMRETFITTFRADRINVLREYSFYNCTNLRSVELNSVMDFRKECFYNCKNINSLIFKWENITNISNAVFYGLTCLPEKLNLPSLSGTLGGSAFRATNVKEVEDLGSLSIVDQYAFYKALSLEKVKLPSTLTAINMQAFAYCEALKVVVCKAVTPPTLNSQGFMLARAIEAIYVPDASVDAYKAATNWAAYADKIKPLSEYNG